MDLNTLQNWLWRAACSIRGEVDAARYKDYILPLVFYKRLDDVYTDELAKLAKSLDVDADTAELFAETDRTLIRFYLPADARWRTVRTQTTGLGALLTDNLRKFDVRTFGLDELHAQMRPDRGMLLLGAHVGSFEALRVLSLQRPDVKVRVVLNTQQTPAMTELLHALNPEIAKNVIDASRPGHEVVFALHDAMNEGALATLLGDRARPNEATIEIDFLGAPAQFPVAPFLIASMLKVPVVLCLGLYRGGRSYDLVFETLAEQLDLPRRGREAELRAFVQRYAQRLEHYVRAYPYNWFNFYDFWKTDSTGHAQSVEPAAAVSGERG